MKKLKEAKLATNKDLNIVEQSTTKTKERKLKNKKSLIKVIFVTKL